MKKYVTLIFGVISIALALFIHFRNNAFFKNAEKTNAYISRIESERYRRNGKTKYRHTAYVTYEVNGVRYEDIELDYYSFDMMHGQTITIYYKPNNPKVIKTKKAEFLSTGLIGFFGGTFIFIFMRNRNRR
ncbi:MAG: DUF3592 domain-containing protein [Lachnospiraceae bacterium]|nr:DUF3592 domain-containing protein [Lachnospiraceae bacterium]